MRNWMENSIKKKQTNKKNMSKHNLAFEKDLNIPHGAQSQADCGMREVL